MSHDPSPWADIYGPWPDPDPGPTTELLAEGQADRDERAMEEWTNTRLWERFAARLTANGRLIR